MATSSIPMMVVGREGYFISLTGFSTITLDGANERMAHIGHFTTPDGATRHITDVCWMTATVTTGDDILVQLETIDANGIPAGIVAANVSGTTTVANTDDNKWFETPLTTHYDLTSGTWLAVTMKMTNASKSMQIRTGAEVSGGSVAFSYLCSDIVGAATFIKANGMSMVALKCDTGEYLTPFGTRLALTAQSTSLATGGATHYVGNKIVAGSAAKLSGVFITIIDNDQDINVELLDASGSLLTGDDATTNMRISVDKDFRTDTGTHYPVYLNFPCPKTLVAGTTYYLVFAAQSETGNNITQNTWQSEALKKIELLIPTGWTFDSVTSPSAFSATVDATKAHCLKPVFTEIASGGGGSTFAY